MALVGAGRNDLAEQLSAKYKEIHMGAERKLKGD